MSAIAHVELTIAAQRLAISWERARRAVLTGKLVGKKRDGLWFVSAASVDKYEQELRCTSDAAAAADSD